jgi:alginate O-acetyltransferase complex protein AlgI
VVFPSIINWAAFLLLAAVYWLLPPRLRLAWLSLGSLALLAFNDYFSALLVLYLWLLGWLGGASLAGLPSARRRWPLWLLSLACLLPLLVLKYQGLLGIDALQNSGVLRLSLSEFAVPIGISYLSFKALLYLLDCGRGSLPPQPPLLLLGYLALAPAVSSGPIDRPAPLLAQLLQPGRLDLDRVLYGLYRIATGVIFKFVLADLLAEIADGFIPPVLAVSAARRVLFGSYYSLQLYFDFAGYSHIAIGAAYLLGIKCMENFAAPLLRPNISEFWRNWHISLTSLLRSYIFLPLAYRWARPLGAQRSAYTATVVTFLICGLWHGDGLNYLLWGLYHGLLLSAHQAFVHATRRSPLFRRLRRVRLLALPAWALTFVLVGGGWYLFAFNLKQLAEIFRGVAAP